MSLIDDYFKLTCSHNLWNCIGKSILIIIVIALLSATIGLSGDVTNILLSINATFWGVTWIIHLTQHWILDKKNCNMYKIQEAENLKKQMF